MRWILLLLVLLAGCSKNTISIVDLDDQLSCFSSLENVQERIDSQTQYRKLEAYKHDSRMCEDAALPDIDFSKNTLLAQYAQGGGCDILFDKKVYWEEGVLVYEVKVGEIGPCDKLGMSNNFVLVPKIPKDTRVEFRTS